MGRLRPKEQRVPQGGSALGQRVGTGRKSGALEHVRKLSSWSENALAPPQWPVEGRRQPSLLKACEKMTTESSCHHLVPGMICKRHCDCIWWPLEHLAVTRNTPPSADAGPRASPSPRPASASSGSQEQHLHVQVAGEEKEYFLPCAHDVKSRFRPVRLAGAHRHSFTHTSSGAACALGLEWLRRRLQGPQGREGVLSGPRQRRVLSPGLDGAPLPLLPEDSKQDVIRQPKMRTPRLHQTYEKGYACSVPACSFIFFN